MLLAVKGNRETVINEAEKQSFIDSGHKILEKQKDGKFKVLHDPATAQTDSQKLAEENKALKADVADLKKQLAEAKKANK